MRRIVVLGLALVALAGPGLAESPAPRITRPDWAELPSAAVIAQFMPQAARRGDGGKALIQCKVTRAGRLKDCTLVSETPPGEGFGAAALKMAGKFKMKPKTLDGAPVAGGVVRIPIAFNPPAEAPAPSAP